MSQENVEVVSACYEAWNRDDFESARRLLHPSVEWQTSGAFPGFEPVYHSVEGVQTWWASLKAPWDWFVVHVDDTAEMGDSVIVTTRFEAVGKESALKVEMPFTNLWQVEDRLVIRFAAYRSWEQALEAVELSE